MAVDPREFWKIAADFPANKEDVYPEHAEAQEFALRRAGERVLEYGCGGGSDAMSYLRRGCIVTYADIVEANVSRTTQRIAALTSGYSAHSTVGVMSRATACILKTSADLPFPGGTFDVVNAHGVIHHIEDPAPVLAAFHRVLRSGGLLYVMLYTEHLWEEYKRLVEKAQSCDERGWTFGDFTDGTGCPYARPYTDSEGVALLINAGFSVVSTFLYNKMHFRTFRAVRV